MKRFIAVLLLICVGVLGAFELFATGTFMFGAISLATTPVVLDTQKIVFLTSLKEEYDRIETWLNEAEDLSMFVEDGQTLRFPESAADPAVYKNKTNDVGSVEPFETIHDVSLDVYDSQNYKLRNIYLHALPFEKIQHYTRKSADAIIKQEIADAAYAFAPATEGTRRLVIPTTGPVMGGFKSMTLDDVIVLAMACDKNEYPDGRNLVLPSDMWWQLVNNNEILKGQLKNQAQTGVIDPRVVEFYGFKIHKSLGDKLGLGWDIDGAEKSEQGAAYVGDVVPAAVMFCRNQVFRAGGNMEMFYKDKSTNPTGRAYEFGFQHRFKADFQMSSQRYSALVYAMPDPDGGSVSVDGVALAMIKLMRGTNIISSVGTDTNHHKVTFSIQYPDEIDDRLTDYLEDVLIEFGSDDIPKLTVGLTKNSAAVGTTFVIAAKTTKVYLSTILKGLVATTAVRGSIVDAAGDTDVYVLTIAPEGNLYKDDITIKSVVSRNAITFEGARILGTTVASVDIDLS